MEQVLDTEDLVLFVSWLWECYRRSSRIPPHGWDLGKMCCVTAGSTPICDFHFGGREGPV